VTASAVARGAKSRLLVHHRDHSNAPKVLVTLCMRCHIRIHRSSGVRHWLSGLLLQLWRELHQHEPMQLRLALHSRHRTDAPSDRPACSGPFSRVMQIKEFPSPEGFVLPGPAFNQWGR